MVFIMANISSPSSPSSPSPSKTTRAPRDPSVKQDTLSNPQTAVVDKIKYIADIGFCSVYNDSKLSEKDFADCLYPAIKSGETVSKIINGTDGRHASLKILAALHFRFDFSIDKMLDDALEGEMKRMKRS